MAIWNDTTKDASPFTNKSFGTQRLTWAQAAFDWAQAQGTWLNPYEWADTIKDASTFVNGTKH